VFGWHGAPVGTGAADGTALAALGRAGLGVEVLGAVLAVALWVSRRPGERLAPRFVAAALVVRLLADSGLLGGTRVDADVAAVAVSVLLAAAAVTSVGRHGPPRRTLDADGALLPVVLLVAASVSLALVGSPLGLPRLPLVVSGWPAPTTGWPPSWWPASSTSGRWSTPPRTCCCGSASPGRSRTSRRPPSACCG